MDTKQNTQKKIEYKCDACEKMDTQFYETNTGDYVCSSCYDEMIDKAEYAYESMLEDQATGN